MPKKSMYQTIYDDILEKILAGDYKIGDRVDSEESLAKKYEVSRITTKKALSLLCEKGYIFRKPGVGSFVADSQNAQAAVSGKSDASGCTLGFIIDFVGNNFALNLFNQISMQAIAGGYDTLISVTHSSQEAEMRAIELMKRSNCKGIILVPVIREFYNLEIIRSIADHYPILTIDRELIGLPAPCVSTDHRKSCYMLTSHLIRHGHKNIAYLTPHVNASKSEELRMFGFKDAMKENSLNSEMVFAPPHHFKMRLLSYLANEPIPAEDETIIKSIAEQLNLFLDAHQDLTALVCCTNHIALLAYNVLTQRGYCVPEDFSIVCFDETENIYRNVYFTHIRQNAKEIAARTIQTMAKLIHGGAGGSDIKSVLIPGALVEGNTVKTL